MRARRGPLSFRWFGRVFVDATKEDVLRGTVSLGPIRRVLLVGGLVLETGGVLVGSVVAAPRSRALTTGALRAPREVLTPLVATPLSSPHPVRGADNRVHLVYELFVINPTTSVMRLKKLQTLDASAHNSVIDTERGARVIATVGDGNLDGATRP